MDISSSKCKCCLKRASERDLNCTYLQFDTGENYAEMIKECFNIELAVNTEDGICEVCISRLRDACDFKTQVQTCQRHFTSIENEEFDKEIPVHEEKLVIRNAESPVVNEELVIPDIPDIDTVPVVNQEKSDNNFLIVIEQMSNSCHEEDLSDADDVTYSQKKRKKKCHPKTKLYKCTYCNFKTDRRTDVKRHERTHTGEKPYKCDFCNFRFSQLGHLNVHQRMHTGEKPYKCAFCDLRSARASNIRKHEKLHNNGHQMKRLPLKKFVEPQTII